MRYFFLFFMYVNLFSMEVFKYTLHDLAFLASEKNNINIILDEKIDNQKIFYFNDNLDNSLSFKTFVHLLKDINYNISYNGEFYYIEKDDSQLYKFSYRNNPNFSVKHLSLLSAQFDVDLSLSDSTQLVIKYKDPASYINFKNYLSTYKPPKHVYLQGEILAVNETKLKEIGIDFTSIASTIKNTGSFDLGVLANVNANDAVKSIISSHGFNTLGDISLFISLLDATGFSKVVTRPNMIIRSGEKSVFKSGQQYRIITGSTESIRNTGEYSSRQYEMLDLGLKLECSATIYNEKNIDLDFKFSIKDVNTYQPDLERLILDNKSFSSKFSIKNNEDILIAGLTSSVKKTDNYSVPFLSDIPYLGSLFTHEYDSLNSISYLIYFKASIK